jgi:hypothetical protein
MAWMMSNIEIVLVIGKFGFRICFGPPWRDTHSLNCKPFEIVKAGIMVSNFVLSVWARDFVLRPALARLLLA